MDEIARFAAIASSPYAEQHREIAEQLAFCRGLSAEGAVQCLECWAASDTLMRRPPEAIIH